MEEEEKKEEKEEQKEEERITGGTSCGMHASIPHAVQLAFSRPSERLCFADTNGVTGNRDAKRCHAMKTSRDFPSPSFPSPRTPSPLSLFLSYLSSWENQRGCVRTCIPIRGSRFIYANSLLVSFFA